LSTRALGNKDIVFNFTNAEESPMELERYEDLAEEVAQNRQDLDTFLELYTDFSMMSEPQFGKLK
jgi:hypothetical protein